MRYKCTICGAEYNTAKEAFECEVRCRDEDAYTGYDAVLRFNWPNKKFSVDITMDRDSSLRYLCESGTPNVYLESWSSMEGHEVSLTDTGLTTFYESYYVSEALTRILAEEKKVYKNLIQKELVKALELAEKEHSDRLYKQYEKLCIIFHSLIRQLDGIDEAFWVAALEARRRFTEQEDDFDDYDDDDDDDEEDEDEDDEDDEEDDDE